ncbi:MAG: MFS transporter [candidate division Zixibacteria bacterium]|nr:MFS transporter [candidate division Zixibacteria bacterium]
MSCRAASLSHPGGFLISILSIRRLADRWKTAELLLDTDFRYLWMSNALWWQCRWMEELIIGWVVLELTDSAGLVALVAFFRSAPFLFFGPFIGTVAQRFSYRQLILRSQQINVAVSGALGILGLIGTLAFWQVALGALLIGLGGAFDWSSRRSMIPDMVGKDRMMDAMMLENIPQNVSRVAGPVLSGMVLEFLGVRWCFPVLWVFYAAGLLFLLRMSHTPPPAKKDAAAISPWKDLLEGLRYARSEPRIYGVLGITLFMNAFTFPFQAMLPVFARDVLHQGPQELGLLTAAIGVGSFIGVGLIDLVKSRQYGGYVFAGSSFLSSISIMGFALSTSYPLSVLLLVLCGIGQAGFSVMQSSMILEATPDVMRGRIMGTLVLAIGGGPPGRLQIGALTTLLGTPLALCISAGIGALGIAWVTYELPGFRKSTTPPEHAPP